MALIAKHKDTTFGVGDEVKVHIKVKEGEKTRTQIFNGMVIGIKGREDGKSFTVRRIGAQRVGIEMIIPLILPTLEKVEVIRKGTEGVQHAKLYYVRNKSTREIEKIYSRASHKNIPVVLKKKKVAAKKKIVKKAIAKKTSAKKTIKKTSK